VKHADLEIENLLELDGTRFVIDELLGFWVKFDVKKVEKNISRPYGIRYSLTLHDRSNERIMGFDNAHSIEYGKKNCVAPKRAFDHWHKKYNKAAKPYFYESAEKLLEDFWSAVDEAVIEKREK
jgi:hypothetical protein